jgi:hypothetical protein
MKMQSRDALRITIYAHQLTIVTNGDTYEELAAFNARGNHALVGLGLHTLQVQEIEHVEVTSPHSDDKTVFQFDDRVVRRRAGADGFYHFDIIDPATGFLAPEPMSDDELEDYRRELEAMPYDYHDSSRLLRYIEWLKLELQKAKQHAKETG